MITRSPSPSAGRSSGRRARFIPLAMPPCGVASPRPRLASRVHRPSSDHTARMSRLRPKPGPTADGSLLPPWYRCAAQSIECRQGAFHAKHPRPSSTAPVCVSLRAGPTEQLATTAWLPSGYRECSRGPLALPWLDPGLRHTSGPAKGYRGHSRTAPFLGVHEVPDGTRRPAKGYGGHSEPPRRPLGIPVSWQHGRAGREARFVRRRFPHRAPTSTGLCPDTQLSLRTDAARDAPQGSQPRDIGVAPLARLRSPHPFAGLVSHVDRDRARRSASQHGFWQLRSREFIASE